MPATLFMCPSCHAALKTPQPVSAGKLIRCPKCRNTFRASGGNGAVTAAEPSPMRPAMEHEISRLAGSRVPAIDPVRSLRDPRAARPPRTLKWATLYALAAVVVAGALGLGVWWYWPADKPPAASLAGGRPAVRPEPAIFEAKAPSPGVEPDESPREPSPKVASAQKPPSDNTSPTTRQPRPDAKKAAPKKPRSQPAAANLDPAGFDDWLQDFEAAKQQAAKEKKDILLLFDGSDWCGWSIRMANEIALQKSFKEQARKKFVLVYLDHPYYASAKTKVKSADRNEKLRSQFHVSAYPTVVLTNAEGRPYGEEGYLEGGADAYLERLSELHQARAAEGSSPDDNSSYVLESAPL